MAWPLHRQCSARILGETPSNTEIQEPIVPRVSTFGREAPMERMAVRKKGRTSGIGSDTKRRLQDDTVTTRPCQPRSACSLGLVLDTDLAERSSI